jgi:hypothetical protein
MSFPSRIALIIIIGGMLGLSRLGMGILAIKTGFLMLKSFLSPIPFLLPCCRLF